jgi:hypothetical protein
MPISFNCPGCGKGYTVPDGVGGKSTKCRACGAGITIPMTSERPTAPIAAAPMAPVAPMANFNSPTAAPVASRARFGNNLPIKNIGIVAGVAVVIVLLGWSAYALLGSGAPAGMAWMPDNCRMLMSVRVAELYNSSAWNEVKKEFPEVEKEVQKAISEGELGPADITQMLIGFADVAKEEGVITFETKKNVDITKFHTKGFGTKPKESKVGSYTVLEDSKMAVCKIHDRMVLMGNPATVKAVLQRDKKPKLPEALQNAMKDADLSQGMSIIVDIKSFANDPMIGGAAKQQNIDIGAVESAVINVAVSSDIRVNSITVCKDAKTADEYRKMAEGGLIMLKKIAGDQMPKEVVEIIDGVKINQKDNRLLADLTIKVAPILKAAKPFVGMQAQQQFQQVGQEIGAPPRKR